MGRARRLRIAAKKRRARILKIVIFSIIFSFTLFLIFTAAIFASCTKDLPNLEDQSLGKNAETSKVYAADGSLLANLYFEQNRVIVPLSEIPESMQQAAVAIEDKRFYKHQGIDIEAILRAMIVNIQKGKIVEGASTITQQYVKNTFITPEKTLNRKIREAILAYQIEKKYSKKKILEKYLNTIYFGQNCYGVEVAAETFFGKKAKDLTLPEAALLAGLIKSPNTFSPYTNPEGAKERRDLTLRQMVKQGFIKKAEAQEAMNAPIVVQPPKQKVPRAPYFVDYVKQQILEDKDYGSTPSQRANSLFKGGLRIYTTLDPKSQEAAEDAVQILNRSDDPSAAIVAIDPKTGYIKALVGGKDFRVNKFNLATQAKRQPGSSFKIFVLVTALEKGYSPYKTYDSSPFTIELPGKDWHVVNATGGGGRGRITIREGTVRSVNCVYAHMIMDVGPENVVETAHRMGITSDIPAYPSIALGTAEVTPLEMTSAASTLANQGSHNKPTSIIKVTDSQGNIIDENKPKPKEVLDPTIAYTATDILQGVITGGTGRAANIGRPAAGKTGTTNSYRDAWFVGYTPDLAASVWVGYPQAQIAMTNVHGTRVYGGTFPAQIWSRFMSKALKDTPKSKFPVPSESKKKGVEICTDSGLLATKFCPDTVRRIFKEGKVPTEYCSIHVGKRVPSVVGMTADQAVASLRQAGFRVSQTYKTSTRPYGTVISQSPRGGSRAAEGSGVTIVISSSSSSGTVPSVVGMTEAQARSTLSNSGYNASVQYVSSPTQAGKVVNQSPSAGTAREAGSQVTIVVAR